MKKRRSSSFRESLLQNNSVRADKRTNRAVPWTARTPLEKREVVAATAVAATAAAAEDYWLDEISASSNMSLQHHQHQDDGGISSDHVFRRIDVNNKGYITRPELTDYVMKYNLSEADTQTIVDSLIPLNATFISKNEFMEKFHETVGESGPSLSRRSSVEWQNSYQIAPASLSNVTIRNHSFGMSLDSSGDHFSGPNRSLQEYEVYSSSGNEEAMSYQQTNIELDEYMKELGMTKDLTLEQNSLLQVWSALRAHEDNTLEIMFKSFVGKIFLEMDNQQSLIQAQSQRLKEFNLSEEDRLMDLQKSAESDLSKVIAQYEKQIQNSIKSYEEKIDIICSEREQLMDELQAKTSVESRRSNEVKLLNSKVSEYEMEVEQLKNELKRVRNECISGGNGSARVHAIDQFTTPRRTQSFRSPGSAHFSDGSYTFSTPKINRSHSTFDTAADDDSLTLTNNEETFYTAQQGYSRDTSFSQSALRTEEQFSDSLLHTLEEPKILSDRAKPSRATGNQQERQLSSKREELRSKRVLRNENTSADLDDQISVTSEDEDTDESRVSTLQPHPQSTMEDDGSEAEREKADYVELDWHQFPNLVEYTFKVILCGDPSVGKTSFLNQLCLREFRESTIATIGMSFFRHKFRVSRRGKAVGVELQCWDTAGQEKFRSLPQSYFRNADAAILMFDVTKRSTFSNLHEWIDRIEDVADFPRLIIIGNKTDAGRERREIERHEAVAISKSIDAHYFEGSAKTGDGVWRSFQQIAEILVTDFIYKNQGEVLSVTTDTEGRLMSSRSLVQLDSNGQRLNSSTSKFPINRKCFSCN